MTFHPPAYIAFTGVDRAALKDGLLALSARYPIEWGMLVDDTQRDNPLFPDAATRTRLLAGAPLRWAAHVCGPLARQIAQQPDAARLDLAGFQRVQVNHGFAGSNASQVAAACAFGRRNGIRAVLQCQGAFPADAGVDWLFDTSFGKGTPPGQWPDLPAQGPFCGYSGGLNPGNVRTVLERIAAPAGSLYWIDMESGIRTNGLLDLAKCEAVCRAVYG